MSNITPEITNESHGDELEIDEFVYESIERARQDEAEQQAAADEANLRNWKADFLINATDLDMLALIEDSMKSDHFDNKGCRFFSILRVLGRRYFSASCLEAVSTVEKLAAYDEMAAAFEKLMENQKP